MAKSIKLKLTLIGAGLWLAMSPLILFDQIGTAGQTMTSETLVFVAMGFVAVAMGGIGKKDTDPWRAASAIVFTVALIATPSWFEFYTNSLALWNTVLVGLIVLLFAVLDLMN